MKYKNVKKQVAQGTPAPTKNSLTVGYSFSSNINTSVSALGFWDSNTDGFEFDHRVGLLTMEGEMLGQVFLPSGTEYPLIDEFRYAELDEEVPLIAGVTYLLLGTTSSESWIYNANNFRMAPNINFLSSYFVDGSSLYEYEPYAFLTINAIINDSTAIPEPTSLALICIGFIGMVFRGGGSKVF